LLPWKHACYLAMVVVLLLILLSLPSNRSTCHSIYIQGFRYMNLTESHIERIG
jgi:hypothetical protein